MTMYPFPNSKKGIHLLFGGRLDCPNCRKIYIEPNDIKAINVYGVCPNCADEPNDYYSEESSFIPKQYGHN